MASDWVNTDNLEELEDDDILGTELDPTKEDNTKSSKETGTKNSSSHSDCNASNTKAADDGNIISFEALNSLGDTEMNAIIDNKDEKELEQSKDTELKKDEKDPKETAPINFEALTPKQLEKGGDRNYRAIRVPGPRMIHIRRLWKQMCDPIVTQLKLQIRMNSKKNIIEIRTSNHTAKTNAIQKGADFIKACVLGFEIKDSIALIRMDDIYLESFDIRDVKFFNKKSDHWLRAIGRIAGQYGKIKYSIENSTNTRIVIFGFKIHILGSFTSIRLARNAISRLVLGSQPGSVYANLRVVSNRMKNRF